MLVTAYSLPQPEAEIMPAFSRIGDPEIRKQVFFDFMRPIIEAENTRINNQRKRLLQLRQKHGKGSTLNSRESEWLEEVCQEYEVECTNPAPEKNWRELSLRIDQVPVSLALAQSASESGWGTSRFAVAGNAMFGQWIYSDSKGMLPQNRPVNARYKVAEFKSVRQSVSSYIRNLNTHNAYRNYRWLRNQYRQLGIRPDGYTLANGLVRYSARRYAYVNEIKRIIDKNRPLMRIR